MTASINPKPRATYCARHMVAWCNDLSDGCPYCEIENLRASNEWLSEELKMLESLIFEQEDE